MQHVQKPGRYAVDLLVELIVNIIRIIGHKKKRVVHPLRPVIRFASL